MSYFANLTDDDLSNLDNNKDSDSTKRTVKRSVKLFREFLGSENSQFEDLSKSLLDKKLRQFFASLRTAKGGEIKKSTLHSVKYGLAKFIKETCKIDITTDSAFESSRKTFKGKLTDLKKKGKGSVDHKQEISQEDLKRLMQPNNLAFNCNTPVGLQNKVWFDIMFHLCRRGRENLRQMTKVTFAVKTDSSGREYVCQVVDEADKNHGCDATPDDTIGEARMYAQPGANMCPVKSFKLYIQKLHPKIDNLWQRPRDSFQSTDDHWYCSSPLGKNTLGTMMASISSLEKLSFRYTNHCIRATSISALDRAGFEARHIIRASGHKSEQSIKSYACRLTEATKRSMSDALTKTLQATDQAIEPEVPFELTVEDLDRIFSAENDFIAVEEQSGVLNVPAPQTGVLSNTTANINAMSPQVVTSQTRV